MAVTIIVKKKRPPWPVMVKGGRRPSLIIGGTAMEPAERREAICAANEAQGAHLDPDAGYEQQYEQRAKGAYDIKPSVKKYMQTGDKKYLGQPQE